MKKCGTNPVGATIFKAKITAKLTHLASIAKKRPERIFFKKRYGFLNQFKAILSNKKGGSPSFFSCHRNYFEVEKT
jgi:hypothetical protein